MRSEDGRLLRPDPCQLNASFHLSRKRVEGSVCRQVDLTTLIAPKRVFQPTTALFELA